MKLRTRLVLIFLTLVLLGVAAGVGITYGLLWHARVSSVDDDLIRVADTIWASLPSDVEVAALQGSALLRGTNVGTLQVFDGEALVLHAGATDGPASGGGDGRAPAHPRTVDGWRSYRVERDGWSVSVGTRLSSVPFDVGPHLPRAIYVTLAVLVVSVVPFVFVVRLLLRPLEGLAEVLRDYGGDGAAGAPHYQDEESVLADGFATLLAQIEQERAREREFLAYAAHELRTPITAIRARLEAQLGAPVPPARAVMTQLHREALRLETLTQNLLAFSRARTDSLRVVDVDLADIVGAAFDRFMPWALESDHELQLHDASAHVTADPLLLHQALDNLVANALRHTHGGTVTITSGVDDGVAFLSVVDRGSGLPKPMTPGLGLRVIEAVAEAHGGWLQYVRVGDETHGRVWLPRPPVS